MKQDKMIDFGEFKSTVCKHGKAIILCSICFDPSKVKDATDWRVKLRHPIWMYRMRKDFRKALDDK